MSVRCDAVGDHLLRTASLPDYNAAYTWTFWFYLVSDLNTNQTLAAFSNNTGNNVDWFRTLADGVTPQVRVGNGGAFTNVGAVSAMSLATWYYFAMVRESATSLKIYQGDLVNPPSLIITNTGDVTGRTAATRMEHGAILTTDANRSDARFDAIKFWSTNLSLEELVNEWQLRRVTRTANLYGWWPCFPGATERLRDCSGNGRAWTEVGTLTDEDPAPISWGARAIIVQTPAVVSGSGGGTLAALTSAAAGKVDVSGSLDKTLAALAATGAGAVAVSGSLAKTLDALTGAGAGAVAVSGGLDEALGSLISQGAGAVEVAGSLAKTLDSLISASSGAVDVAGQTAGVLDPLTVVGVGDATPETSGSLDKTLDNLAGAGVGAVAVNGSLAKTLGDLTGAGAGTVAVSGAATPTLDALTSAGAGAVAIGGSLDKTLSPLTLDAVGLTVLIVGIVKVAFSAKQPGVAFSARRPGITFTTED